MRDRVLAAVLGPVLTLAGWSAWTGRWRSWAHPYSGRGLLPLAMLPIGITVVLTIFLDPGQDLTGWRAAISFVFGLPGVVALPAAAVTAFYTPKRFPGFLRPRWLPPNWRPPVWVDARAVGIKARFGPALHPSSVEVATQAAGGARSGARWHAHYEEQDPAVPYLNLGLVGMRWCVVTLYPGLVTIAQTVAEDRLHQHHFVIAVTAGDVRGVTLVPGKGFSWRSMRHRHQFPRLVLKTATQEHSLAFRPRFGRSMKARLKEVERALGVQASR